VTIDNDPLFDAGWPESARAKPQAQTTQGGYGISPQPGATDEQIIALAMSQGLNQDNARSYLRGWRQPK
jgi:hypothetical protein